MAASLLNRVTLNLIGFEPLFAGAALYTFNKVLTDIIAYTLEDYGLTEGDLAADEVLREGFVLRATLNALLPIKTIYTNIPKRRRIEVGVESEYQDYAKTLDRLSDDLKKMIREVDDRLEGSNTFILKSINPDTDGSSDA